MHERDEGGGVAVGGAVPRGERVPQREVDAGQRLGRGLAAAGNGEHEQRGGEREAAHCVNDTTRARVRGLGVGYGHLLALPL